MAIPKISISCFYIGPACQEAEGLPAYEGMCRGEHNVFNIGRLLSWPQFNLPHLSVLQTWKKSSSVHTSVRLEALTACL
eukprot:1159369-Pelagomonas_calceolata.AAC.12